MAAFEFTLDMLNARISEIGKEQERILLAIADEVELCSIVGTVTGTFGRYDVESIYQQRDKDGDYCCFCTLNLPCSADVEVKFSELSVDEKQQIIEIALNILDKAHGTTI